MQQLSGWGRVPVIEGEELLSEDLEHASEGVSLSRGLGRSYGDASLPASSARPCLGTRLADRILSFDGETGVLRAEAGFSVRQLNQLFLARGWATPVNPGTQYVTLGGMVAADVHGKNHHVAGCIGAHVHALRLRVADGRVLEVGDDSEPELFRATLGGMGLTGHILEVELQLQRIPSAWIWRESERVGDLDALVAKLRAASRTWPFTVAWVDCAARSTELGRGILSMGRWAEAREAPGAPPRMRERFAVPCQLPSWFVGPWSIRGFNALYYRRHGPRPRSGIVHPQSFFYPLDTVRHWNRLYGRRGMVQYQCVLPLAGDGRVHRRFFEVVARHGGASPVSVIKDCGTEGRGLLSFPMPGISVALDLPFRERKTQALVDALNEIVIEAGGRVYLAKDALTRPEHFAAMEPRLERFRAVRSQWDPDGRLASAQSVRLLGGRAVRVALLGATRGMGRALARELAGRGARLCLLGRDAQQLARSARDLELRRAQGKVTTAHCDLLEPESFEPALEAAERALDGLDTVVVTAALFDTQEALEADAKQRHTLLTANFVHTVQFCEAARARLLARGGGTLCVFSSVAGERGRQRVILYGAAKAGLSRYLEGLDHKFRKQGLRVVSVKPGFVKTSMTAQLDAVPFAGEPERVAARVARAIERGEPVVYVPGIWRWIMWVIRLLPRAVLRRIDF